MAYKNVVHGLQKEEGLSLTNQTEETVLSTAIKSTRTNRKYTDTDKSNLFALVFKQGLSTNAAALQLGMPPSTAYTWIKKEKERQSVTAVATNETVTGVVTETVKQSGNEGTKENLFALVFEQGMSTNAASIKLAIPRSTASSWVKKEKEQRSAAVEASDIARQTAQAAAAENLKVNLFALVFEQGMSTNAAAIGLGIPPSTAYSWINKEKERRDITGEASSRTAREISKEDLKENLFAMVFEQGLSTNASAIQLGMPPSTAYSWIKKEKERRDITGEASSKTAQEIFKEDLKKNLFVLVFEQGMSTNASAIQLGMPPSTAYNWINQEKERQSVTAEVTRETVQENVKETSKDNAEETVHKTAREISKETSVETSIELEEVSTKDADVKPGMGEEHEKFLTDIIEEKLAIALAEITKTVTEQFTDLDISQTSLKQLVNQKCKASLEKSDACNSPIRLEERYHWAAYWKDKDMDYMSNCVFIDETDFHIKLTTLSKVDTMKPVTKTVFGAVSTHGLVNAVNVLPKNSDNSLF
ncbi:hypothetical protein INT47_008759, partial [Mucor saturninus]